MVDINRQLLDLNRLWTDPTAENLAQIRALCDSMEEGLGGSAEQKTQGMDLRLVFRAYLLAGKAQRRIEECVAIQTRTGSYSGCGTHEISPRVATAGWEG